MLSDITTIDIISLLNEHRESFYKAKAFADIAGHTVPCDTKSWSQVLVSYLSGIPGLERKKGADLIDGSDVKAANAWDAIDKPRFNGVLLAGRVGTDSDVHSLDSMPFLFFVLWDWINGLPGNERCRVWYINTQGDQVFRSVASEWYDQRASGSIKSANFQLHPPIHKDTNIVTNECGNLDLPLLFEARWIHDSYIISSFTRDLSSPRSCSLNGSAPKRLRK